MEELDVDIIKERISYILSEPGSIFIDHRISVDSMSFKADELILVLQSGLLSAKVQDSAKEFIKKRLSTFSSIKAIKIIFTSQKDQASSKSSAPPNLKIGSHPKNKDVSLRPALIGKIIAIGSGKGGVGKSTFVSNLAVELDNRGFTVGIIDADMHGPSQPTLLGSTEKPQINPETKKIIPTTSKGIKFISIGLMVPENQAVIWRGPMLMGALEQFLRDVEWGELDFLLVDLPPGTGDVQLTLSQKAQIDGSIIISTPQDVALIDARKAIQMFDRLKVKIFGLVENMSSFVCSNCGHKDHIFGNAGVKAEAEALKLPFLGEIPLDRKIREYSDKGTPSILANPSIESSKSFAMITDTLLNQINKP